MVFSITFLIALTATSAAQNNIKDLDADLYQHLKNINKWRYEKPYSDVDGSSDSVAIESTRLIKKMLAAFNNNPSTLSASFDSLKTLINIASSPDGKFRIYSWDTEIGGTMRFFANVIQFKTNSGTKAVQYFNPIENISEEPGFFYDSIYQVAKGKEVYYLARRIAIFSSRDVFHGIKIFKIHSNRVNDTAVLIKTKTGIRNEIGYFYDFISVVDIDFNQRPRIRFNNTTNTLYIPVVVDKGKVTNKTIRYKFNGQYFIKQ